jgi:hypothetical protein
MDVLPL